jgi:sugar lactone lactonase YvrE
LPGFVGTEDITFDDAGHVIESDQSNVYKTTRAGMRTVFVPNLPFRAGMRMTRHNKLIIADDTTGSLWRIDPDGSRHQLMTGLQYPNGMEIGNDGFVYFTDQSAGKVFRVDPETGANTVLTTAVPEPNGLTFDPTGRKLYIGSFCGSPDQSIYVLDVDEQGQPGALGTYKSGVGSGCHDGMGVDECGNLYVADYGESRIYRVTPAGAVSAVVESNGSYHSNFDWGRGVGGWESDHLYVLSVGEGIKDVALGVHSKARQ